MNIDSAEPAGFTAEERDYIRREFDQFFSTLPSIADGLILKTHKFGPDAGQPKLPSAGQGLLAKGLVRLAADERPPQLYFTEAGLALLRAMMTDKRLADPRKFAHIRQELGIDPAPKTDAAD